MTSLARVGRLGLGILSGSGIIRAYDFSAASAGLAPVYAGLTHTTDAAANKSVQNGVNALIISGLTQNLGRIGQRAGARGLVSCRSRTQRISTPRDVEQGTAGLNVAYSASGVVGPDGTGTPKRVVVQSAGYSRFYNATLQPSLVYCASAWYRGLVGGESAQLNAWAGTGTAVAGTATLTTAWQRLSSAQITANTTRGATWLDGRNLSALITGGLTAALRDAVIDCLQEEDGRIYPGEWMPGTADTGDGHTLTAIESVLSGWRLKVEFDFEPWGAATELVSDSYLWYHNPDNYIRPVASTRLVDVRIGGSTFTTALPVSWIRGDRVGLYVEAGGNVEPTRVFARYNGGASSLLGVSGAPQAVIALTGASSIMGGNGVPVDAYHHTLKFYR